VNLPKKLNEEDVYDDFIIKTAKSMEFKLFFSYALTDTVDPKAEQICRQLKDLNINICIVTKGD